MIDRAQIIFLHGASSSGKSTLARALQNALPLPFWHISIDHLRDSGVLPSERFRSGEFDWKIERSRFFEGYHHSLVAYARAGNNLILEHILEEDGWFDELARLFSSFDVFFVALHCPANILEERELARGDRPRGSALQDYHSIHKGIEYDLELDALAPLEQNIRLVIDGWMDQSNPSAFEKRLSSLTE